MTCTHEYLHELTQVFEKYGLSGEVGAAVGLGANSVEYLQSLGFDIARANMCRGEWHEGISTWSLVTSEAAFQTPLLYNCGHRLTKSPGANLAISEKHTDPRWEDIGVTASLAGRGIHRRHILSA